MTLHPAWHYATSFTRADISGSHIKISRSIVSILFHSVAHCLNSSNIPLSKPFQFLNGNHQPYYEDYKATWSNMESTSQKSIQPAHLRLWPIISRSTRHFSSSKGHLIEHLHCILCPVFANNNCLSPAKKRRDALCTQPRAAIKYLHDVYWASRHREIFSHSTCLFTTNYSLYPNEASDILLDRTISSAFVKQIARTSNTFLVSPELFDVLNKLLKSDEETARGDAMLLCKLFSGE